MKNLNPQSANKVVAFRWVKSPQKGLLVLNQLLLPHQEKWITCRTHAQVADCIRHMAVRGAPAIGCVAAYGLVLAAWEKKFTDAKVLVAHLYASAQTLFSTRPTAINLYWALERMKNAIKEIRTKASNDRGKIKEIREYLEAEANEIYDQDLAGNHKMGELGSELLSAHSVVLTHCNTGSLATSGWGTALGVIRTAYRRGRIQKVLVDETRPYLQGARLTAWELAQDKIPYELITDNMAAHLMKTEKIDAVLVGSDRIASNGDVANKIGTYGLAVLAHFHRIPFYVVAPTSTVDLNIRSGSQIPIEERSRKEVTHIRNLPIAPLDSHARHPAFDVTPHGLVTAIVTEKGVVRPPTLETIQALFNIKS
ncbi:MAG: S-methyl-5-thioribose-1-phosphate isomerase [Elusimicrobia bacterium]|nr:S-methyl-5-thioribose-1-phosphate isomerase [Elusimicrobiota bacterium]MBI3012314.1 S-methyl-5-thioribose-1-phosphate isomerase [Elusimicrobiota bacterium]